MNLLHSEILRVATATLGFALLTSSAGAADTEPAAISAKDLAASLSALQDGASYVRLRLEVKQPARHHEDSASTSDQGAPHEDGHRSCLPGALAQRAKRRGRPLAQSRWRPPDRFAFRSA